MVRGLALAWFVLLSVVCRAADVRVDGAALVVNEVRIYTFQTNHAGLSPSKRAELAAQVVKEFDGKSPVQKLKKGKNWQVAIGTRVVCTLTPEEARPFKVSPQSLAATIAQRLTDTLTLPALAIEKTSLQMPPGKTVGIKLTGYGASKAKLTSSVAGVVTVARGTGVLNVTSLKPGETKIVAQFGENSVETTVAVLPYAFDPRQSYQAQVVGRPADSSVVAGAVASALQAHESVPNGVVVWAKVANAGQLAPGESRTIKAKVHATGTGYFPYDGEVSVKTKNIGPGVKHEDELWYSNDPENIEKPCQLYWAELLQGKSARLLFHHKNEYFSPVIVRYLLANPSDLPAVVTVSVGEGRPDMNPTRAGYIAGDQFLSKWMTGSAEVLTIPPRSTVPLSIRRLGREETCSGLASISLLAHSAPNIVVIGESILPMTLFDEWQSALNVNGAWHAARPRPLDSLHLLLEGKSQDVFLNPFRQQTMDYEAGGRFGFARIGEQPLVDETNQRTLLGNFGVVYDIRGSLTNPTPEPVEVEVLFEASAGYGSGLFYINGDYVKLGLIKPKQEIVLASIKLPPGANKALSIQTMPLSGANYPVTLIVRPTGFELQSAIKR